MDMKVKSYLAWFSTMSLVFNLLFSSFLHAQTARNIAQETFPSVVLLMMEDSNGQPLSLGSGFFVRDDVVATNLHVVKESPRGYAKIVGQKTKYEIEGFVGIDTIRDLALLKISGVKAPFLNIGDSQQVKVGDEIYAVGNPMGLEGTFSQGIISSVRQIGKESIFQITAPISPGSSGGPVLNSNGKVIGVAVATFKGGQNLNFAIPSSYLSSALCELKPVFPIAKIIKPKKERSILDDLGGRSIEGVKACLFKWTDNPYMGQYNFSIRNQLRQPVRNVYSLVIFYGQDGLPIDTEIVLINGPVGPNLAKRSDRKGRISADEVRNLTKRVELRILDFEVMD